MGLTFVLIHFGRAVDDIEGTFTSAFRIGDALDARARAAKSEEADQHTEEASHAVSGSVRTVFSVVPVLLVDPDASEGKAEAVAAIDAEVEEAHGRACHEALLQSNLPDILEEPRVVVDLKLLLPE